MARTSALMSELGERPAVETIDETVTAVRGMEHGEVCVLPSTPHPFEQVRLPLVASSLRDFVE